MNTMHIIFRHASFAEKQGGMCWHLILARYRVKGFSAWESFISSSGTTLMFRLSPFDLISVAEAILRVTKFNVLSAFRPITPSIWPQMKECSKGIVFVSSRQLILIYKSSQSEFVCKSYSQYGADQLGIKILRWTSDTCWWVSGTMREQLALEADLRSKSVQHESFSSRQADRFSYINCLDPS